MTEKNSDANGMTRRRFLGRLGKAGVTIGLAGGAAAYFHDPVGPGRGPVVAAETISLPDYSIPSLGARMAVARGSDRAQTLSRALDAVGGIDAFIRPGDKVLLKVNAAFATPPALGATTHPDVVLELTRLALKAGAAEVRVSDNPINDPAACFKLTGLAEAAEKSGARLLLPRESAFRSFTLEGAKLLVNWPLFHDPLLGIDKVIGVAPLKDHHRSGASMTMKNWYGLLGGRRNMFHQDIHTTILELARMMRPTFVVLDATVAMKANGPTGGSLADLASLNQMIVSTDQVAADAFGCALLERPLSALPFLAMAAGAGVGTLDYESLKPAMV